MKSCLGHGPPRESIQVWMPPLSYNIVLIVESRLSYPIIKLVAIILACSACLITECRVPGWTTRRGQGHSKFESTAIIKKCIITSQRCSSNR